MFNYRLNKSSVFRTVHFWLSVRFHDCHGQCGGGLSEKNINSNLPSSSYKQFTGLLSCTPLLLISVQPIKGGLRKIFLYLGKQSQVVSVVVICKVQDALVHSILHQPAGKIGFH